MQSAQQIRNALRSRRIAAHVVGRQHLRGAPAGTIDMRAAYAPVQQELHQPDVLASRRQVQQALGIVRVLPVTY